MKRIIPIILCLVCLCTLLALPVVAAPIDPLAAQFQEFLYRCEGLYSGDVMEYVCAEAAEAFVSAENPGPVEVPAADFEAELEKYIVLNDAVLEEIRRPEREFYNQDNASYTVELFFGGGVSFYKQYKGYVKTGENTYDVYYQAFERGSILEVVSEDKVMEIIQNHKNPITGEIEYNGRVYMMDEEGPYYVKSWGEGGNKYSIEVIDGKMRFISGSAYGADEQPETFDDSIVTYDLPKDNTVYLDNVAYFPDETLVKVEKITGTVQKITQAMAKVSTKYVAYEFTATQNDVSVQPTGKLKVHFVMPEDLGANTVVMYMAPDGTLSELHSMVKNIEGTSYLVADLEHFSTYILVDKDAKPAEPTTEPTVAPTTEPTTVPTTAATNATTKATVAETEATNATTEATNAATQATTAPTKATAATATKPIYCSLPLKPTVPATGETVADPTEETIIDPTGETTVAPTEEVPMPTDETAAAPTEAPTPAESNKTGGIIAAVIIVIVLAGGGFAAWWFYFRKKAATEETEETEE